MNSLQKLYEQGRREGRQEGRHETASRLLRRMLQERFGTLAPAQSRKLDELDAAAVEAAFIRAITAESIESVLG